MRYICTNCYGTFNKPKNKTPGSLGMEILLWLIMILPGLLYSLWRTGSKKQVCPHCGSLTFIPTDTPLGQRLFREQTQLADM